MYLLNAKLLNVPLLAIIVSLKTHQN